MFPLQIRSLNQNHLLTNKGYLILPVPGVKTHPHLLPRSNLVQLSDFYVTLFMWLGSRVLTLHRNPFLNLAQGFHLQIAISKCKVRAVNRTTGESGVTQVSIKKEHVFSELYKTSPPTRLIKRKERKICWHDGKYINIFIMNIDSLWLMVVLTVSEFSKTEVPKPKACHSLFNIFRANQVLLTHLWYGIVLGKQIHWHCELNPGRERCHVNYLEPIWCYQALLHPLNSTAFS